MFDAKNDYSLNKSDPDAIVYRSSDGVHIRLTREEFGSEEEFLRWKNRSDEPHLGQPQRWTVQCKKDQRT